MRTKIIAILVLMNITLLSAVPIVSAEDPYCPSWYRNVNVGASISPDSIDFNSINKKGAPTDITFMVDIVNCGCENETDVSLLIQETSSGKTLYYNPEQISFFTWTNINGLTWYETYEITIPISELTLPPVGSQWVDMDFVVTVLQKDWQLDYDLSNNMRTATIKVKPPRK